MFDKNVFAQHIANRSLSLEEQNSRTGGRDTSPVGRDVFRRDPNAVSGRERDRIQDNIDDRENYRRSLRDDIRRRNEEKRAAKEAQIAKLRAEKDARLEAERDEGDAATEQPRQLPSWLQSMLDKKNMITGTPLVDKNRMSTLADRPELPTRPPGLPTGFGY